VYRNGNEINNEVIWSIQYTRDPLTNGGGNNAHVFFLMEYDTQPGMPTRYGELVDRSTFLDQTDYTLSVIFAERCK